MTYNYLILTWGVDYLAQKKTCGKSMDRCFKARIIDDACSGVDWEEGVKMVAAMVLDMMAVNCGF